MQGGQDYSLFVHVEDLRGNNDGTLSDAIMISPDISSRFASYPALTSAVTTSSVSFGFQSTAAGKFWAYLVPKTSTASTNFAASGNLPINVIDDGAGNCLLPFTTTPSNQFACIKAWTDKVGGANCRKNIAMTAAAQTVTLTGCSLDSDAEYNLFVYVEDANGNHDGEMSQPVPVTTAKSNSFQVLPEVVSANTGPDKGSIQFRPSLNGWAWTQIYVKSDQPTAPTFAALRNGGDKVLSCPVGGYTFVNAFVSGNTVLSWTDCKFIAGTTYVAYVYLNSGSLNDDGTMHSVEFTVTPSNSFHYRGMPRLLKTPGASEIQVSFEALVTGKAWLMIAPSSAISYTDLYWKIKDKSLWPASAENVFGGFCSISGTVGTGATPRDFSGLNGVDYGISDAMVNFHMHSCAAFTPGTAMTAWLYIEGTSTSVDLSKTDGSLFGIPFVSTALDVGTYKFHTSSHIKTHWTNGAGVYVENPPSLEGLMVKAQLTEPSVGMTGKVYAMISERQFDSATTAASVIAMTNAMGAATCKRTGVAVPPTTLSLEHFTGCGLVAGVPYTFWMAVKSDEGAAPLAAAGTGELFHAFAPLHFTVPLSNSFAEGPQVTVSSGDGVSFSFAGSAASGGKAWAMLSASASTIDAKTGVADIKASTGAIGSASCKAVGVAVPNAASFSQSLSGCGLVAGSTYFLHAYITDASGGDDGLIFGSAVSFTVPHSNGFALEPVVVGVPTTHDLHLRFAPTHSGKVWAYVSTSNSALPDIAQMKTNMASSVAAGNPTGCMLVGAAVSARQENSIAFTLCDLAPGGNYWLLLYVEDGSGFNDGKFSAFESFDVASSNRFVQNPVMTATPDLDSLTFQFKTQVDGKVWGYVIPAADVSTVSKDSVKVQQGGMGAGTHCKMNEFEVTSALQTVTLSGCGLSNKGSYYLVLYAEDMDERNDGAFARHLDFSPPKSNYFTKVPQLSSAVSADGFTFVFNVEYVGVAFAAVVKKADSALLSIADLRSVGSASPSSLAASVGAASCRSRTTIANAAVDVSIVLTGCGLLGTEDYELLVYIEDSNNNADGMTSAPINVLGIFSLRQFLALGIVCINYVLTFCIGKYCVWRSAQKC